MLENSSIPKRLIRGKWYKVKLDFWGELISSKRKIEGNYAIFINRKLRYMGESQDLIRRLNQHIQNMYIYLSSKTKVILKFRRIKIEEDRKEIERKLILRIKPIGNKHSSIEDDFSYLTAKRNLIKEKIDTQMCLTKREIEILKNLYGLGDDNHITFNSLQTASKKFGLSRQRIGQIEQTAIKKLKRYKKIDFNNVNEEEKLECLGFSTRCMTCFKKLRFETLRELKNYCDKNGFERLYLTENFGHKSMMEVKNLFLKINNEQLDGL